VHVTELGADYFQYDEARHELRGERTGMRYQLTDRVTVQVSRVDLDARKIDLRLVSEPGIHTQLKNEARRADAEQENKKSKQAGTTQGRQDAPAPAYPTTQDQGAAERKSRSRRGEPGLGGAAKAAQKARSPGKNAGDKSGSRKKRQK
jgi:ribonuclease R